MIKDLPKLTDLDRINLQELITDPRFETLKKLCELLKQRWLIEIPASRIPQETEFDYIWRQATRESKGEALVELLIQLETESYPEEKTDEPQGIQQSHNQG